MKLFRLGDITFRIHWVFLLLLFICAFYGYLPEMLILFGLVLLHELVHLQVAKAQGLEVGDVELLPFGGVAKIEDVLELDPQVESTVSIAGPLFNFFLVAVAIIIYNNVPSWQQNELFLFFIRSNLTLALFNLLPALPLDGGRILRARLCAVFGFQQATDTAIRISKFFAFLLLLLAIYFYYLGEFNVTLFAAAIFLFYAAEKEKTVAMYAFIRGLGRKKKILYEQGVMPLVTLIALPDAVYKDILRRFAMKKYHRVLIINKNGSVLGEVMEEDVIKAIVKQGLYGTIKTALYK